jgi:hypothetical protein
MDRYRFNKKRIGTCYAEHVFLDPGGSASHVVQTGVSGARSFDELFSKLGCYRYGFNKKHAGTCYTNLVFLHPVGSVGHVVQSSASGE